jgi:hypothetical protein
MTSAFVVCNANHYTTEAVLVSTRTVKYNLTFDSLNSYYICISSHLFLELGLYTDWFLSEQPQVLPHGVCEPVPIQWVPRNHLHLLPRLENAEPTIPPLPYMPLWHGPQLSRGTYFIYVVRLVKLSRCAM